MRYPADHKERSHERIVAAASRLFRENGVAATGVDAVMTAAGLTAGGFYSHFESKRALLAEALSTGVVATSRIFEGLDGLPDDEWLATFIRRYLSRRHRDEPATGCPVPTLGAEIAAGPDDEARAALIAGMQSRFERLESHFPSAKGSLSARQRAIATFATLVGGLMLARVVRGSPLSDEVLAACRAAVTPEA